jgi:hypothetical protein
MAIGGDGGGQFVDVVVEIVPGVEGRGRRHPPPAEQSNRIECRGGMGTVKLAPGLWRPAAREAGGGVLHDVGGAALA